MARINVSNYGALGVGGDDTGAVEAACAAAKAGDTIEFDPGRFGITRTIRPPCSVRGSHQLSSLVALPGSGDSAKPLIDLVDKSDITISDMCLEGSGEFVASGSSHVGAVRFGASSVAVKNIRIERCALKNHKSEYWILASADLDICSTVISENTFETKNGDMTEYDPPNENGGQLLTLYGSETGTVRDTKVSGNIVHGIGVPIGFGFFGSHRVFDCSRNQFTDMGKASLQIHNSYAIVVYALGNNAAEAAKNRPSYGTIQGNNIYGCQSAGIYTASAASILISENYVSRQERSDDSTLPRGGIAINGGDDHNVTGNTLEDCWCGISKGGPYQKGIYIHGNRIFSSVAYSIGMRLEGVSQPYARISVKNNDIMLWSGASTAYKNQLSGPGDIIITNNSARATANGLVDATGTYKSIGGNLFFVL